MEGIRSEVFFLPLGGNRQLCVLHRPVAEPPRGAIVYLHPFAEELNKSRRAAAVGSRALAAAGWVVLQIDLLGCGDSSGDFSDATWEEWVAGVQTAHAWIVGRWGPHCWIWGLRAGCLLAAEWVRRSREAPNLLFWQPVVSGNRHLEQFLRLKVASGMLGSDPARAGTRGLKAQLAQGESLEIAGYRLSPSLASGLGAADLELVGYQGRIIWCEVSSSVPASLSPAARTRVARIEEQGAQIETVVVQGPPFWQTLEIEECPGLAQVTVRALAGSPR